MEVKIEVEKTVNLLPNNNLSVGKFRQWFRDAADFWQTWQQAAREDYEFVEGRQWSKADLKRFEETRRPPIVINRIKPLLNLLSGYERLNKYDISFLGRTPDDVELCAVREGITKYVLDRCDYSSSESAVFLDAATGGLGWFSVGYEIDEETGDGEAVINREFGRIARIS